LAGEGLDYAFTVRRPPPAASPRCRAARAAARARIGTLQLLAVHLPPALSERAA